MVSSGQIQFERNLVSSSVGTVYIFLSMGGVAAILVPFTSKFNFLSKSSIKRESDKYIFWTFLFWGIKVDVDGDGTLREPCPAMSLIMKQSR